jgi:hypothetical protein
LHVVISGRRLDGYQLLTKKPLHARNAYAAKVVATLQEENRRFLIKVSGSDEYQVATPQAAIDKTRSEFNTKRFAPLPASESVAPYYQTNNALVLLPFFCPYSSF